MTKKKHADKPVPAEGTPTPGGRDLTQDSPDVSVVPKDTPPISE